MSLGQSGNFQAPYMRNQKTALSFLNVSTMKAFDDDILKVLHLTSADLGMQRLDINTASVHQNVFIYVFIYLA